MQTLDFQYTLEDYREAAGAHYARRLDVNTKSRRLRRIIALCILGVGALAISLPIAISSDDFRSKLIRMVLSISPLLPWIALFVLMSFLQTVALKGVAAIRLFLLSVAAFAAVLGAGAMWLETRNASPQQYDYEHSLDTASWIAWAFFALFWLRIFVTYLGDKPFRRIWNGHPQLHSPKTLTIDDEGLVFCDPLITNSYRWPAFARSMETPALFVLYVGDQTFVMVPKRAFKSAQGMEQFRAMIDHYVQGRTRAFPVMPLSPGNQQQPTVPVESVES
jgi:hypothetical protein